MAGSRQAIGKGRLELRRCCSLDSFLDFLPFCSAKKRVLLFAVRPPPPSLPRRRLLTFLLFSEGKYFLESRKSARGMKRGRDPSLPPTEGTVVVVELRTKAGRNRKAEAADKKGGSMLCAGGKGGRGNQEGKRGDDKDGWPGKEKAAVSFWSQPGEEVRHPPTSPTCIARREREKARNAGNVAWERREKEVRRGSGERVRN